MTHWRSDGPVKVSVGLEGDKWYEPDENGWLPIESAPKDGTCILACRPYTTPDVIQWSHPAKLSEGKWRRRAGSWAKDGDPHFEPTHWMPLPLPPPPEQECNHAGYNYDKDGRRCGKCGAMMVDFGD